MLAFTSFFNRVEYFLSAQCPPKSLPWTSKTIWCWSKIIKSNKDKMQ